MKTSCCRFDTAGSLCAATLALIKIDEFEQRRMAHLHLGVSPLAIAVEVLSAMGLISPRDKQGCEVFCEVRFKKMKFRTRLVPSSALVWNEKFKLGFFGEEDELELLCWDKERLSTNEPMGYANISLREFASAVGEHPRKLNMYPRPGVKDTVVGAIEIKIIVKDKTKKRSSRMRAPTRFVGGIMARRTSSLTPGAGQGTMSPSVSSEELSPIEADGEKANVRNKLTSFFKFRPSKDELEDNLRKSGIIQKAGTNTKVFNASLDEVMSRQKTKYPDLKIPAFVHSLLKQLLADPSTFNEAGLFRISGAAVTTQRIRGLVDAGREPDLLQITRDDCASLLKEYIRELPEPIFTFHLASEWLDAARISDSQIVPILRVLVRKLPGHNRHLWQAVNEFLHQLSKKSEINMMTPQNIGIVIGPNVLWQPPLCMPMMEMNTVVMNLVIYCNEVWAPGPEDDPMSASGPITPRTPSRKNSVIVSPGRPAAATIAGGQGVAAAALAAALSARRGPPAAAATHHHHHHGEHPHAASSSSIITRTPSAAMMAAYDAPGSRDDSQISSDSAKSPRPLVSPRQAPNTLPSTWDVADVAAWLTAKGYAQYVDAFKSRQVDGKKLMQLTPDILLGDFGIQSLGHRKKIVFRMHDLLKLEKDALMKSSMI